MSEQNLSEIWQVEVSGQIYEAPFGELSGWIAEGSLLPADKVRKGDLRWIEARKVPALIPFFNAKEKGLPVSIVTSTADGTDTTPPLTFGHPGEASLVPPIVAPKIAVPAQGAVDNSCSLHPEAPTAYRCDGCGGGFCKICPKCYGGSVRICPSCGSMCRSINEVNRSARETQFRTEAISEGFGGGDFFRALAHPLKFKTSLLAGGAMFAAFSVGQSVSAIGGIFMMASALVCVMLANMLTFGVLANTVENFSQGRLEANFMPSFDDFSLWDDMVHPFFLSIGVYLSSFGPFLVTLAIGFYLVMSTVTSHVESFQSDLERLPGTHYYDARRTVDQSERVKSVIGNLGEDQERRIAMQREMADGNSSGSMVDRETLEQERLWAEAQDMRKVQLESAIGKTPETREQESQAMIQGFLKLAAPLVVLGSIFFLWGAFYFPAACAVAGYTRSFMATLNPAIGLDTIKRLGLTYVKVLLMCLLLVIMSGFLSGVLEVVFSPFDLPRMGNIPAKAIGALFGFYLSVVFSCITGYALFKASDKLALLR